MVGSTVRETSLDLGLEEVAASWASLLLTRLETGPRGTLHLQGDNMEEDNTGGCKKEVGPVGAKSMKQV